jgi:endoglucanase
LAPTWGDGEPTTDWKRAAEICGNKVLKIAPQWLIFIGGINYQLDLTGIF